MNMVVFLNANFKFGVVSWLRLDSTLFSLDALTIKTDRREKMRRVLKLSGRVRRLLVHLHRLSF